jgi:hypothetical protein
VVNYRDLQSSRESSTELWISIGSLALAILIYYFLRMLHVSDTVAAMLAFAAVPVVLGAVRSFLVRRSGADRDLREAQIGAPVINPVLVCVATAASLAFIEAFISSVFGLTGGALLQAYAESTHHPLEPFNPYEVFLAGASTYVISCVVLLTWPVTQVAAHYLSKRAILWIIASLILFQMLDLGFAFGGVATSASMAKAMGGASWGKIIAYKLVLVFILIVPSLFGYFCARRTQPRFLLRRAFRKLNQDDRGAVLDLLSDRQLSADTADDIT